ncbi:hypothetical protein Tco_0394316 [Tanacetum coccineum]
MTYNDKYKKILDEIWKDKVELDGKTMKEDEEAVKRIKDEALKEKDNPGAFIFPIRLEGKVNKNALADTGSDTTPYRIFKILGREDMKKIDRGITMIDHTQAKAMGKLSNVLCQVGVTTIITKFLILDIPIDRDAPIVVGRGFLRTMAESDSDDEEEYVIKRNKFGAPIYPYLNCTNPEDQSSAIQAVTNPFRKISVWKKAVSFLGSLPVPLKQVNWKPDYKGSYTKEEEATGHWRTKITLLIRTHDGEVGSSRSKRLRNETVEEFDEVCADDEFQSKKIIRFRLGGRAHSLTLLEFARILGLYEAIELEEDGFNVYFEGGLRSDDNFNATGYWLSLSREENLGLSRSHTSTIRNLILRVIYKMITYGLCQRTTGYDKVQKNDLWLLSMFDARHKNGYANIAWYLYDRMGRMEIRQDAIERMKYRQSYHRDIYHGVFEHMAGVYSVPLQGSYNPPGYAQP